MQVKKAEKIVHRRPTSRWAISCIKKKLNALKYILNYTFYEYARYKNIIFNRFKLENSSFYIVGNHNKSY